MHQIFSDLYASEGEHPLENSLQTLAYLVRGPKQNLLVCNTSKLQGDRKLLQRVPSIHIPDHCSGSTCYLIQGKRRNCLFTGDTLYLNLGKWQVAIEAKNAVKMIQSLLRLRNLKVKFMIPDLYIGSRSTEKLHSLLSYQQCLDHIIKEIRFRFNLLFLNGNSLESSEVRHGI